MVVLNDHTISIGNEGFYGTQIKSSQPLQTDNWDSIKIERGLPRVYPVDILPRILTFQITDNSGDRIGFLNKINGLQGIQDFIYVDQGSFSALIVFSNLEHPDSQPEVSTVQVTVTEVRPAGEGT
jgi:hypothetical protein